MCPGFVNETLEYIIPVIDLDASHLRSEHKGTLYLATAKSPLCKIYTIAVGIPTNKESLDEWSFFKEI
jgi:hypothetical protein